ncbi:MAG: PQQ-dependent sugar dehydrogenase [Gelidibacter sp.]
MKRLFLMASCTFFFFVCNAQLPQNYSSNVIQSGYSQPMGTLFTTDGTKMFVWTYSGQIFVSTWDGSQYVKQNTPVLDISDEVLAWRDFGLLGLALDPNFDTNGLIYMFYAVERLHATYPDYSPYPPFGSRATFCRLTRYRLNHLAVPMTTDYTSRFVLIGESLSTGIPLLYESHAGGSLAFGTDGTLLVSTGDNASYSTTDVGNVSHTYYQQAINEGIMRSAENVGAMRSQMVNSLCGKILRLDPNTGNGVPSNPFYDSGNPRSAPSRMWAMGFRNPFRMVLKPNSGSTNPADANPGTLFVVDVGWNVWEDLHVIDKPGLNAGWPLYEGQTSLSSYYNSGATNPDEGNQLFKNLCVQPTSFVDNTNPTLRRFVHNRPEVTWRHGTNDARVPWFNGTTPTDPRVGSSGAPTTGVEFRGNTGVSGVYIDNCGLGPNYKDTYFFTDYAKNFINVASLNDGSLNWISHIEQFAPENYGDGIVHMVQNPRDGSIYFTNIFTGQIKRIYFTNPANPTWTSEPMDMTVECSANSAIQFENWKNSFSGIDQCNESAIVSNNSSGLSDACGNTGKATITFTLRSINGTSITKVATFSVVDSTAPTFNESLPSDATVECDAIPSTASLTASDTCGSASVTFSETSSGSCTEGNHITRTWTATDDCGNQAVHTQTLTVVDTSAPNWVISPSDMLIECSATANDEFVAWLASFSGTDNCGSATVSHNSNGNLSECGTFETVSFVLTDECGNSITQLATFTIDDTLGLNEVEKENIKVYPNPSFDYLIIKGLKSKAIVLFYNIAGQLILKREAQDNDPLHFNLASGIYFLKIETESSSVNRKLIVK